MDYAMTLRTNEPVGQVEARVRQTLADQGFGILTEIDVQATLKKKIDVDRPPMTILGACNPRLANRAIEAEPTITAFLPCNVTVYVEDGTTVVSAMKPTAVMSLVDNPRVAEVAREAERLVWDALKAAVPEPLQTPPGAPA
jgi:uncharacterized protein (DUF302 family)